MADHGKGRAQCPNTRNVSFTGRAKCWHQLGTDFKRPETREEVEDLQGLAAASEELLTGYLIKNLSLLLFPPFPSFLKPMDKSPLMVEELMQNVGDRCLKK